MYNNEIPGLSIVRISDSLMPRPLPQCGKGLGHKARITDYKREGSMCKLLDPVEAGMAMVSWGFLDSVLITCPGMLVL